MSLNKIKWILGISVVFLLILFTNLIDRQNFDKLNNSISSIYEDRLVAKNLVLEMVYIIHDKELALRSQNAPYYQKQFKEDHTQLDELMERFKATKLVDQEEKTLQQLEEGYRRLEQLETSKRKAMESEETTSADQQLTTQIERIEEDLYTLSNIQLDEGKRQMLQGKSAADSVQLMTTIEVYILVALALVIQVLILYSPNRKA
jgi:hypothetical protein